MSVYLVIDWLVPKGNERATVDSLAAVREHVLAAHPGVRGVRVTRQVGDDPSVSGFRWEERYDSQADHDALVMDESCDEVWLAVWERAVPGSHRQSVWDDGGRADWLNP